jgi:hypothetical protein
MPNVPEIPDIRSNNIQTPRVDVPFIRNLEPPPILVPINRTLPKPVVDVPLDGIPQYEPIDAPTTEEFRRMVNAQQEPKKEEEIQDKPRALPDLNITDALKQVPQSQSQQQESSCSISTKNRCSDYYCSLYRDNSSPIHRNGCIIWHHCYCFCCCGSYWQIFG